MIDRNAKGTLLSPNMIIILIMINVFLFIYFYFINSRFTSILSESTKWEDMNTYPKRFVLPLDVDECTVIGKLSKMQVQKKDFLF